MEGKIPLIGDKFPEMKVQTTHGEMTLPKDTKGKWTVLFSHPADFTPVCTTEFIAFQDRWDEFEKLNTKLIGLSIDQVFSHIKWVEWIQEKMNVEIKFPVIADDRGFVAEQLGLVHPGKGTNTVRAVFFIDPDSVMRAMLYYPQELGRNMDEILRVVEAFQVSDKQGVAMPADWPNNKMLEDRVIVPPAKDVETARKRMEEYDNFDWWFCHKPLKK